MKITFTPQLRSDALSLSLDGDVLTINDNTYDFGALADGSTLPREAIGCDLLASDVIREGDHITLTLILPHSSNAPKSALFPQSITVTQTGPIPLPVTYAGEVPE